MNGSIFDVFANATPAWFILLIAVTVLALISLVTYTVAIQGRAFNFIGLTINRRETGNSEPLDQNFEESEYRKLLYVKVLYLSQQQDGKDTIYYRNVERLEGERVPVFDESIYYALHIFNKPEKQHSWNIRSSGIVDPHVDHPWKDVIEFPDKDAQHLKEFVTGTIREPSNVYLVVSHLYNGLQPGHEDVGIRMDRDTGHARLVVDFSSIPNSESLFREEPRAVCRVGNEERLVGLTRLHNAIFTVAQDDLKKDDALRIDFKIAWEKL